MLKKNQINYFLNQPRSLFLFDSIGAAVTAFLLFFVLRNFNEYFGLPKQLLTYLSVIGLCFCIYSACCFVLLKRNFTTYLKLIGFANLAYCGLTLVLLICYFKQITTIGLLYFIGELFIIISLVYIEFKVADQLNK